MASKKSKKNQKNKPAVGSLARGLEELRRRILDLILKMMNDVSETYGDPEGHRQTRRECAAALEAYGAYAGAMTGDQYMFNLQSKYSSDETVVVDTFVHESTAAAIEAYAEYAVVIDTGDQIIFNSPSKYSSDETVVMDDTFVDESTAAAAESGDLKTFSNLFEKFLDKLNDMAWLLPVSKTGKAKAKEGDDVNVKAKERTTLIRSGSDAKGRATGEKEDLVGLEEQLLEMRYQSLHQNNRYIPSTFEYNGGLNVSTNLGTDKIFCKY